MPGLKIRFGRWHLTTSVEKATSVERAWNPTTRHVSTIALCVFATGTAELQARQVSEPTPATPEITVTDDEKVEQQPAVDVRPLDDRDAKLANEQSILNSSRRPQNNETPTAFVTDDASRKSRKKVARKTPLRPIAQLEDYDLDNAIHAQSYGKHRSRNEIEADENKAQARQRELESDQRNSAGQRNTKPVGLVHFNIKCLPV